MALKRVRVPADRPYVAATRLAIGHRLLLGAPDGKRRTALRPVVTFAPGPTPTVTSERIPDIACHS
jgi:hypothetical protein